MTNTPEKEYTMTITDLQTVLDYLAKRPLGEVLEVFKAVQRAKPVETTVETPSEQN